MVKYGASRVGLECHSDAYYVNPRRRSRTVSNLRPYFFCGRPYFFRPNLGKPPPERSGGLHNAPTVTLPACYFASTARRYFTLIRLFRLCFGGLRSQAPNLEYGALPHLSCTCSAYLKNRKMKNSLVGYLSMPICRRHGHVTCRQFLTIIQALAHTEFQKAAPLQWRRSRGVT